MKAVLLALVLAGCTPLAYQQQPELWNPCCTCTTDEDCAERCGGNGDPEPMNGPEPVCDEYAADADQPDCPEESHDR